MFKSRANIQHNINQPIPKSNNRITEYWNLDKILFYTMI